LDKNFDAIGDFVQKKNDIRNSMFVPNDITWSTLT